MEEYAAQLHKQGYGRNTAREFLRAAAHLSRFALWEGVTELSGLDEAFACRFINEHLPACSCERLNRGKYTQTITGVWHALRFLSNAGIVPPPAQLVKSSLEPKPQPVPKPQKSQRPKKKAPSASMEAKSDKPRPPRTDISSQAAIMQQLPESMGGIILQYDEYLDSLFGLCKKTREVHRLKTMLFLKWVYDKHNLEFRLEDLRTTDILEFQEMCNAYGFSNDYRKTVTSCLRGFLRFLRWQRILEDDLTPAVYKVKEWKLATVPKFIPYETAELLLSAPDRSTVKGKRDYLAMLFMLQLGLRADELIQMQMDDIFLEKGEVFIPKTKSRKERSIPLTDELADAIVDYLRARPRKPERTLFLRTVIPYVPLASSAALGSVVRRYIEELGIAVPSYGTHLLRHTLATHMVNAGVSFKSAADILGHESIETTGIYAKVQIERLKHIALPFPCWREVCAR
jgi:site-specific recombinase XerD